MANRWLLLFALSERGIVSHRYRGRLNWEDLGLQETASA